EIALQIGFGLCQISHLDDQSRGNFPEPLLWSVLKQPATKSETQNECRKTEVAPPVHSASPLRSKPMPNRPSERRGRTMLGMRHAIHFYIYIGTRQLPRHKKSYCARDSTPTVRARGWRPWMMASTMSWPRHRLR